MDVGDVGEDAEAVGKPRRDEELAVALVVELEPLPLPIRRRVAAQVDGDVPDPPAKAAHELGLPGARLEMKAAQDPAAGARVVVLDELAVDARRRASPAR